MSSHAQQARTLVEALPYIQKFTGKTIVVKYGGNAMVSDELRRAVMCDIILLSLVGIRVVVVHGGGPEISEMLKKLGHESRFVDGLRYTDAETMDVVQSVLCGKVNKNLVAQLNRLGGQAIGVTVSLFAYSAVGVFLPAVISLWGDIRLRSNRLRRTMAVLGLLFLSHYVLWASVLLLGNTWYPILRDWFYWLLNLPFARNGTLFLSGCLLFLSLNK